MSMPAGGSTAPAITSSLLAWPSRPSARSSPLSTPSTGIFDDASIPSLYSSSNSLATTVNFPRSESWNSNLDSKGKARNPEVRVVDEDMLESPDRKLYPPPRRPLSHAQLGRIAQSFGIIIPTLPQPGLPISPSSPTHASAPSAILRAPRTVNVQTRPTPYLLAVIPPVNLLPPTSAASLHDSKDLERRWKRGRLLPLQPTIGSMLLCIAREYGLPSTTGLGLYLVHSAPTVGQDRSSPSSSTSLSSFEEASGPLISPQTWSTLFSGYIHHSASSPRASTPSHTPLKGSGSLGPDIAFPSSPLSLLGDTGSSKDRLHSFSAEPTPTKPRSGHSSNPSTSSSNRPLPPASIHATLPPNPIVGTIEFDVDPEAATWLDEWRRSGGPSRRKGSTIAEGGARELKLVMKHQKRQRSLRDLDQNINSPPRVAEERSYVVRDDDDDDHAFGPTPDITLDGSDPLLDTFLSAASEFAALRASRPVLGERRFSIKDIGTNRVLSTSGSFGVFSDADTSIEIETPQIEDVIAMLETSEGDELLASPIELDAGEVEAVKQRLIESDKRGSGWVMSDQLDDLEKLMRQLSPREIRLTSPRILTPRMAAKVASASLDLPPVPSRSSRPAPSPLASQSTASKPELAPPLTWPAVPYAKLSDSPASPSSIQEYFPKQEPAAMLRETLERMRPELPAKPIASEWRPRRPVRPPSPRIEHTRTLSHSLSPDLVDHLRSPGESSPSSPAEEKDAKLRQPRRNNSISLKGLRHQRSGKNINTLWRRDEKDRPEVRQRKPSETVGLFTGGVEPVNSSFAGLRPDTMSTRAYSSSNGTGEFGTVVLSSPTTPVTPSLPNRPSQNGFASRMLHGSFSFSRKPSNAGQSKRSPSISSPVANTFHRIDSVPTGTHSSPGKSPGSPAPPKSVKRKPVPGLRGSSEAIVPSESLHSMRSFVLEDPPKKRVPMGVAL